MRHKLLPLTRPLKVLVGVAVAELESQAMEMARVRVRARLHDAVAEDECQCHFFPKKRPLVKGSRLPFLASLPCIGDLTNKVLQWPLVGEVELESSVQLSL
jgi:hypothetical protein